MSATTPDEAEAPKSKKKLIMIVAVLAIAAGAYFFVLKPKPAEGEEPPPPVPGEVLVTEPIQVNLAEGHYLRIGIALQMIEGAGAHGAPDPSKALDLTIEEFSGHTVGELSDHKERAKLKKELLHHIEEAYHHEVMDVYFTEFVTQ